ncbi:MAG: DUF4388 domain-containing protein [Nitrospirota bacterium]
MPSRGEKRRFKRFKSSSTFDLSSGNKIYKAHIIDYSLKGIGFYIDESPPVTLGPEIHLRIEDFDLDEDGKIVWLKGTHSLLKGGIERKSISGSLTYYPLADILLDLQRSEKNGVLRLKNDRVIKRIFVKNGDMVYATSNAKDDLLLQTLLRAGKITPDQYNKVILLSKEKGTGQGLIELGYLKPEDLIWAVRNQVEEIILSLFQWKEGKFAFLEGPLISGEVIALKLSAANLIYRGIKKIDDLKQIKNAIPPMDTVLCHSVDPLDLFQDIRLDETEKDILFLINGKQNIKEILSLSPLTDVATMKILYALISTRIVSIKEEDAADDDRIRTDVLENKETIDNLDFSRKIEDFSIKIGTSDHYGILGIEKWATLDTIKKAYYTAAKELHPDRHLHHASDEMKTKLHAIFSRLTEAYGILSDPKTRIEYDKSLSRGLTETKSSKVELARMKFREGSEAFEKGLFTEAKKLFEQAIYLDDTAAEYRFCLGLVLQKERKWQEAGKIFSEALKFDPSNPSYLAELGHTFLEMGFSLRARATFEKVKKIDPLNERAAEGLARLKNML